MTTSKLFYFLLKMFFFLNGKKAFLSETIFGIVLQMLTIQSLYFDPYKTTGLEI